MIFSIVKGFLLNRTQYLLDDLRARVFGDEFGGNNNKNAQNLVLISGLPKSGSTLVERLVALDPGRRRWRPSSQVGLIFHDLTNSLLDSPRSVNNKYYLKTHAAPHSKGVKTFLERGNVLVVTVRDLCDVAWSHKCHIESKSEGFSGKLSPNDLEDAIVSQTLLEYVPWVFGYNLLAERFPKQVIMVNFEELVADPQEVVLRLNEVLGMSVCPENLESVIGTPVSNKNLSARLERGADTFRSGIVGEGRKNLTRKSILALDSFRDALPSKE